MLQRPLSIGLAGLLTAALAAPSYSQSEQTLTSDPEKSRGAGQEEAIKNRSAVNDPQSAPQAPPEKGGDKSRGGVCYLNVDNRTPWKIQVFVDNQYVGLISPWGNASGSYSAGSHQVLGYAEFSDPQENTYWGPTSISCQGKYTWTLTDTKRGYQ